MGPLYAADENNARALSGQARSIPIISALPDAKGAIHRQMAS